MMISVFILKGRKIIWFRNTYIGKYVLSYYCSQMQPVVCTGFPLMYAYKTKFLLNVGIGTYVGSLLLLKNSEYSKRGSR